MSIHMLLGHFINNGEEHHYSLVSDILMLLIRGFSLVFPFHPGYRAAPNSVYCTLFNKAYIYIGVCYVIIPSMHLPPLKHHSLV